MSGDKNAKFILELSHDIKKRAHSILLIINDKGFSKFENNIERY